MNRIEKLREYIDDVLQNIKDEEERRCSYVHLYGVAQSCAMIASRRGINAELATMAGMLHDFYLYKNYENQDFTDHGRRGSIFVRAILDDLKLTTEEETNIICCGIANHCDKDKVDLDFDEVIKDADVIQHCLYNVTLPVKKSYKERYEKLIKEFDLNIIVKEIRP